MSGIGAFVAGAAASALPVLSGYANYKAQEENLKYTKEMQQESWRRDDTALQRRVADAEAAGLNPQLALGSGASNSGVVATSAPQHPDYAQAILNVQSMIESVKSLKLDNKLKQEQSTLNHQSELKNIQDITEKDIQLQKSKHDFEWYKNKGMPTDAGNKMTEAGYMFDLFKNTRFGRQLFGDGATPADAVNNITDDLNDFGSNFKAGLQNTVDNLTKSANVSPRATRPETFNELVEQEKKAWQHYHEEGKRNREMYKGQAKFQKWKTRLRKWSGNYY